MMLLSLSMTARKRQQGVALLMGLVLLLIMTLLGVSAMRGTTLQERMAGALHDQNLALQRAETAMRAAEDALVANPTVDFSKDGWYNANGVNGDPPDWINKATEETEIGDNKVATVKPDNADASWMVDPEYYVERVPVVTGAASEGGSLAVGDGSVNTQYDMFKIVARGFGNNKRTVVVLESFFRR